MARLPLARWTRSSTTAAATGTWLLMTLTVAMASPTTTSGNLTPAIPTVATEDYGDDNGTTANATASPAGGGSYEIWQMVLIAVACGVLVVGTIVGNVLVVTAVVIVRRLRTPSNLLIVSLAISDLLVALLVMPFAAMLEATGRWQLGQTVCDVWTSLDVLLCTASILNLCAISVDRYFVITRPFQYAMKRTPARMAAMIAAVWVLSAIISIPPLFGWKSVYQEGECIVSQHIGYQFYATIGAFYLPLTIMIIIYVRIYLVSSRISRAEALSKPSFESAMTVERFSLTPTTTGAEMPRRKDSCGVQVATTSAAADELAANGRAASAGQQNGGAPADKRGRAFSVAEFLPSVRRRSTLFDPGRRSTVFSDQRQRFFQRSRFTKISSSHERKATKTLGVIMGAFTACWLPFFILALIKPFCRSEDVFVPQWLASLFLWLGYANSLLNPIIYARFNRDFRTPFKHILQCHVRDINTRLRSDNYTEQFGVRAAGGRSHSVAAPDWLMHHPRDSMTPTAADVISRVQSAPGPPKPTTLM